MNKDDFMQNWKTNIGGAVSVTGTTLIGVGVLGNLNAGTHSTVLWYIALVGFILSAIGKGLTAVFAADASTVKTIAANVQTVAQAVDQINKGGTDFMAKPVANSPAPNPLDDAKRA